MFTRFADNQPLTGFGATRPSMSTTVFHAMCDRDRGDRLATSLFVATRAIKHQRPRELRDG